MSLETLLNEVPPPTGKQCRLNIWLHTLNEDDRVAFWKAMDNEQIPTRHIWRTIRSIGCPNQESSVRSHRRAECISCEKRNNNG